MAPKASVRSASSVSNMSDDDDDDTCSGSGCDTSTTGTSQLPSKSTGAQVASDNSTTNKPATKGKSNYKHIPHSQKPPHLVAKRNARERRRVTAVNDAFHKLRRCVPIENRNKRVSKVKTLQRAIDYIRKLEDILADDDVSPVDHSTTAGKLSKPAGGELVDQQHNSAGGLQASKSSTLGATKNNCDSKRSLTKASKAAPAAAAAAIGGAPRAKSAKTQANNNGASSSATGKLSGSPGGSLYSNSPRSDRINMASSSSTSSMSLSSNGWYPLAHPVESSAGDVLCAGTFSGYQQQHHQLHQQQVGQNYTAHGYPVLEPHQMQHRTTDQRNTTTHLSPGYSSIHKGPEQSHHLGQQYYGHYLQPAGMQDGHVLGSLQGPSYYSLANSYSDASNECTTRPTESSAIAYDQQHKTLAPLVSCAPPQASPKPVAACSSSATSSSSLGQSHSTLQVEASYGFAKASPSADVQRQRQQQQLSADADSTTASYLAAPSHPLASSKTQTACKQQQLANRDNNNSDGGSISSPLVVVGSSSSSNAVACNDFYTYPDAADHLSMSTVHERCDLGDIGATSPVVYQQLHFDQGSVDERASSKGLTAATRLPDNGKGELELDVHMQGGPISSTFDGFHQHHQQQHDYRQQQRCEDGGSSLNNQTQFHYHHHQQQQQQQERHHRQQHASQSANINGLADSTTATASLSSSAEVSASGTSGPSQLMIHHHNHHHHDGAATTMNEIRAYSYHQTHYLASSLSPYQGQSSPAMQQPPPQPPTHHVQLQAIQEYTL